MAHYVFTHLLHFFPFVNIEKIEHRIRGVLQNRLDVGEDTVLVDRYRHASTETLPVAEGYKGLRIHALSGLHDYIEKNIFPFLNSSSHVLDLASGSGAMSLRLHDLGFDVTATDIVPENFRIHDLVPFLRANLNENFSHRMGKTFDAIVGLEIIEHLENPRNFFRECFKLLNPGGKLVISTPNTDNPVSKAMFVHYGVFQWFSDADFREQGHITPVTQWYLSKCAEEAGFQTVWKGSYGNPFQQVQRWIKLRILAKLLRIFSLNPQDIDGEIFVLLLKKP